MTNKRLIAIHLPQFYPFPENDECGETGLLNGQM